MLLFLLSFFLNPFRLAANWLLTLYLGAWPVLIQTLGREALLTQALVIVLFLVTSDLTRNLTLRHIGFDLISLPVSVALLAALFTDQGASALTLMTPIFGGLLTLVEPLFLMIEIYLFMDMIRSFNKWLSEKSNIRDEEAHDLSTWEAPLSRGAILCRFLTVCLTIASYAAVYIAFQESKSLLGPPDGVPVNFNHAMAALVTLHLIAFAATIYRDDGIISEPAMVAALATVPIFLAAWSYQQFKIAESAQSSWSSYFPFSLLVTSDEGQSSSSSSFLGAQQAGSEFGDNIFHASPGARAAPASRLEQERERLLAALNAQATGWSVAGDSFAHQALRSLFSQLIMMINSIFAKYYFGPEFWYILTGRLVCLYWWARRAGHSTDSGSWRHQRPQHRESPAAKPASDQAARGTDNLALPNRWWPLPLSRTGLIKILFVLLYTQMIIQQMDNRGAGLALAPIDASDSAAHASSCCSSRQTSLATDSSSSGYDDTWIGCLWRSMRGCSQHYFYAGHRPRGALHFLQEAFFSLVVTIRNGLEFICLRLASLDTVLLVWISRWRSPIVQRLFQSILVQLHYIGSMCLAGQQEPTGLDF